MKLSRLALAACIVWAIPATASAAARSEANRSALLFRQHCKFDASGAIEYCAAECRVRLSVLLLLGKVVRLLPRWCRLLRLEPLAALQPLALDLVGRATSRPRSFGRCQRQWIRKQSDVRPAGRDHVTAVVGKEIEKACESPLPSWQSNVWS